MKSGYRRTKVSVRPLRQVKVSLDTFETKLALKLGDTDLRLGIRRAIVLAGLGLEKIRPMKGNTMDKTADRLTIVADQMNALAAELRQLGDNPSRREEIIVQIVRLGRLYLTITAGTDLSLKDL
jgi:hypothetical protein